MQMICQKWKALKLQLHAPCLCSTSIFQHEASNLLCQKGWSTMFSCQVIKIVKHLEGVVLQYAACVARQRVFNYCLCGSDLCLCKVSLVTVRNIKFEFLSVFKILRCLVKLSTKFPCSLMYDLFIYFTLKRTLPSNSLANQCCGNYWFCLCFLAFLCELLFWCVSCVNIRCSQILVKIKWHWYWECRWYSFMLIYFSAFGRVFAILAMCRKPIYSIWQWPLPIIMYALQFL